MSYYIHQRDGDFLIKAKDLPVAYGVLLKLRENAKSYPRQYKWQSFERLMLEWGYSVYCNNAGDCDIIEKDYGKLLDDENMLHVIAPYVEHGSYLEFEGEDGYIWRWVFKHKELYEVSAKIVWEDDVL